MPSASRSVAGALRQAYHLMHKRQGHQDWWPGDSPFEICLGAILTQNTAWSNVERALHALRTDHLLAPHALHALTEPRLTVYLRPAGCHRIKARRVRAFLHALITEADGDVHRWLSGPTQARRSRLLEIPGIGPETADCMLLYAGGHPKFVIDAYTRRIFARHEWSTHDADYDALQSLCETALAESPSGSLPDYWGDYHAQLVQVGKQYCRKPAPACADCPLESLLDRPVQPRPSSSASPCAA